MEAKEVAQAMLSEPVVELVGPFRGDIYYLRVNKCKVPHIHLYRVEGDPLEWTIVVDDRFAADVTYEEIIRWGYVFGNAMAVAAGYNHIGPEAAPMNNYRVQLTGVGLIGDLE